MKFQIQRIAVASAVAIIFLISIFVSNTHAQVISRGSYNTANKPALLAVNDTTQPLVVDIKRLTLAGAKQVIAAAVAAAREKNAPGGSIAVVDDGGNLIALERLDNSFAASARVAFGKAHTAALFKHSTSFFEDAIHNGRNALIAMPDFTPLQGGVTIEVGGQSVGAIGVSGTASAQQDEEIAIAGSNAL